MSLFRERTLHAARPVKQTIDRNRGIEARRKALDELHRSSREEYLGKRRRLVGITLDGLDSESDVSDDEAGDATSSCPETHFMYITSEDAMQTAMHQLQQRVAEFGTSFAQSAPDAQASVFPGATISDNVLGQFRALSPVLRKILNSQLVDTSVLLSLGIATMLNLVFTSPSSSPTDVFSAAVSMTNLAAAGAEPECTALLPAVPRLLALASGTAGAGFPALREQAFWLLGNLTSEPALCPRLARAGAAHTVLTALSSLDFSTQAPLARTALWALSNFLKSPNSLSEADLSLHQSAVLPRLLRAAHAGARSAWAETYASTCTGLAAISADTPANNTEDEGATVLGPGAPSFLAQPVHVDTWVETLWCLLFTSSYYPSLAVAAFCPEVSGSSLAATATLDARIHRLGSALMHLSTAAQRADAHARGALAGLGVPADALAHATSTAVSAADAASLATEWAATAAGFALRASDDMTSGGAPLTPGLGAAAACGGADSGFGGTVALTLAAFLVQGANTTPPRPAVPPPTPTTGSSAVLAPVAAMGDGETAIESSPPCQQTQLRPAAAARVPASAALACVRSLGALLCVCDGMHSRASFSRIAELRTLHASNAPLATPAHFAAATALQRAGLLSSPQQLPSGREFVRVLATAAAGGPLTAEESQADELSDAVLSSAASSWLLLGSPERDGLVFSSSLEGGTVADADTGPPTVHVHLNWTPFAGAGTPSDDDGSVASAGFDASTGLFLRTPTMGSQPLGSTAELAASVSEYTANGVRAESVAGQVFAPEQPHITLAFAEGLPSAHVASPAASKSAALLSVTLSGPGAAAPELAAALDDLFRTQPDPTPEVVLARPQPSRPAGRTNTVLLRPSQPLAELVPPVPPALPAHPLFYPLLVQRVFGLLSPLLRVPTAAGVALAMSSASGDEVSTLPAADAVSASSAVLVLPPVSSGLAAGLPLPAPLYALLPLLAPASPILGKEAMWVLASATGLLPSLADALATDALGAEVAAGQHQPTTGLCGAAALLAGDTGPLADAARAVIATTLSLGTTLAGVEDVATSFVARISSMDSGAGCAIGAHPTLEGVSSGTAVRQHTAVTDHDICARDVGAGRSNKRRPDATVSLPSDSASAAVLMKRSAFVPLALKKEAAVLIHNVISVAFRPSPAYAHCSAAQAALRRSYPTGLLSLMPASGALTSQTSALASGPLHWARIPALQPLMSATSLIDWTVSAPLSLLSAAAADAGGLPAAATVLATFAAGGDFTHHRWPLVSAPTSSSSTAASKVVSAIVMLIFSVDVDAALVGLRLSDLMLTHGAPELRQMLEEQGLVDALTRAQDSTAPEVADMAADLLRVWRTRMETDGSVDDSLNSDDCSGTMGDANDATVHVQPTWGRLPK